MSGSRSFLVSCVLVALVAVAAVVLVATSLRRPELPTYPPTPAAPRDVGAERVGPVTYTVDASDPDRWRFFHFARGSVVEDPGPLGWDLAFRRFNIIVNGGEGFPGEAAVVDMGAVDFTSVATLPEDGYEGTVARRDSVNATFRRWYQYGFASHLLTPRPRVYGLRTADGRYAKMEILSYYCPGALPGCLTFRYVYQGEGGRELDAAPDPPGADRARSPDRPPS